MRWLYYSIVDRDASGKRKHKKDKKVFDSVYISFHQNIRTFTIQPFERRPIFRQEVSCGGRGKHACFYTS